MILGANPLGLAVARRAQQAGCRIVAIADIDPDAFDRTSDPELLATLAAGDTDLVPGYTVAYARGSESLEQVLLTGVDGDGQRIAGAAFPVRADTLVVAIGTLPSLELPYVLGAQLHHDPAMGGTVPTVSIQMASSIPGVFIVGDAAGSTTATFATADASATRAAAQGRTAARSAIAALSGTATTADADTDADAVGEAQVSTTHDDATPASFGGHLTRWHQAAIALADADVVICRCEGVTLRDINAAAPIIGERVPDEVKRFTRAGMGQCQGRGCRVIVAGLLAARQQTATAMRTPASPTSRWRPTARRCVRCHWPPSPPSMSPKRMNRCYPPLPRCSTTSPPTPPPGWSPPPACTPRSTRLLEENHLARAANLSDAEIATIARALRETVRHVTVH